MEYRFRQSPFAPLKQAGRKTVGIRGYSCGNYVWCPRPQRCGRGFARACNIGSSQWREWIYGVFSVPEPSAYFLLGAGLGLMGFVIYRRC
ncbi:MAG: PEP-CTERM sorting domain-containing protein [Verrucomicrobiales bacterium]|nr:PEP-CTERM sorting domain-containing protein [Verrucomicrobiales bacterium]